MASIKPTIQAALQKQTFLYRLAPFRSPPFFVVVAVKGIGGGFLFFGHVGRIQSTYILKRPDSDEFIFMADIWRPKHPSDARYIWLPIEFSDEGKPVIRWRDEWAPKDGAGAAACYHPVRAVLLENGGGFVLLARSHAYIAPRMSRIVVSQFGYL